MVVDRVVVKCCVNITTCPKTFVVIQFVDGHYSGQCWTHFKFNHFPDFAENSSDTDYLQRYWPGLNVVFQYFVDSVTFC